MTHDNYLLTISSDLQLLLGKVVLNNSKQSQYSDLQKYVGDKLNLEVYFNGSSCIRPESNYNNLRLLLYGNGHDGRWRDISMIIF